MQKTHAENSNLKKRLPGWLKQNIRETEDVRRVKRILKEKHLHTVCQEAGCPNIADCFRRSTATFLILGDVCTRNCRFCGVATGNPGHPDLTEPVHVAEAARDLGLKHVVITSVTRDDLPDGGAEHYAETVRQIRHHLDDVTIEILIPDFQGNQASILAVLASGINILNHNIETAPRLYSSVRPEADFQQSLDVLAFAKSASPDILTKSGFMLGLGETEEEVISLLESLSQIHCDAVTIGQYLAPSLSHYPVQEFIPPKIFTKYDEVARSMGFASVRSGPFVRSSFHAEDVMEQFEGVL